MIRMYISIVKERMADFLFYFILFYINLNNAFVQVGFKMFLGVTASVTNWDADGTCCSIVLEDNPLADFVELPDACQGLCYCNILGGVVRGALEMVSLCSHPFPLLVISLSHFTVPPFFLTFSSSKLGTYSPFFSLLQLSEIGF